MKSTCGASNSATPTSSDHSRDVSVVVLTRNRHEELLRNLPPLCTASDDGQFELIIVDNDSTDGSRRLLEEISRKHPGVRVLLNEANLGPAGGRNTGARVAEGELILFVDDDISVGPDEVRRLCETVRSNPGAGIISPRVVNAYSGVRLNDHGDVECAVGNYPGGCHLVVARAMQAVGESDPLCAFGGEELDHSIRMHANGFSVLYTPFVTVQHNSVDKVGDESIWRRRNWVYNYSRVLFKHFPIRMAGPLAFRHLASHMLSGVRIHGGSFALSLLGRAIRGALAGRRACHLVPIETQVFYSSPGLRPEFGNVPLRSKAAAVIARTAKSIVGRRS